MKDNNDFAYMWTSVHSSDFLICLSVICRDLQVRILPAQFKEIGLIVKDTGFNDATASKVAVILNAGDEALVEINSLTSRFKIGLENELKVYNKANGTEKIAIFERLYNRYILNCR